ncbi:helix-turn-helix domain-containing protein [Parenemella sanctibonifatiensis]|uniref:UDP-N-acetylglucosamine 1-carboxyvinyltransferase n=1 Tax=Parenemella sanctibonifatiensis TaxID=2016505 RepID=A0A255ECJ2_9ACTN|nr:UDP-N-acetylglucosamine 1-carboxyvinyltransferase [Parenemella sanctibonifatiensis]OYN89274.1 UDP-N-acetylglucosamine 1-carboxyvinyltransferase [Parenemella sanctibonifatiensis]
MTTTETSPAAIGTLIREARKQRGLTQQELADQLSTSQSAIGRIEAGKQNVSLDMINRIATALQAPLITPGPGGPMNLRITGGHQLSGSIEVRSSKNAAVALLCASLLNKGRTVLRGVAKIEEVNRILEVLSSIGVSYEWSGDQLTIQRPAQLNLAAMDVDAARRTRSIIMFMGPLLHSYEEFSLPYAGGCDLGARTIEPHLQSLRRFGLEVLATEGFYRASVDTSRAGETRQVVLTERGDTVTENTLMAAAMSPGTTIIRNASPNYMVQDLCAFLIELGVQIKGLGTTTLEVTGVESVDTDVEYWPSEDPIEAMSLITAAVVTESELTITRVPIEFLEIELAVLAEMGLRYHMTPEYTGHNGLCRLVDLTIHPSDLTAAIDKVHPMPFPGLNIDNLPFFAVIAASANGRTMIHDWVYENRAIHLVELNRLGARVELLDPHRIVVTGPTRWRGQEIMCPPALRPAVCLFLAALAARGTSVLRDVYVINRGYEDLPNRLNALGAQVEVFYD